MLVAIPPHRDQYIWGELKFQSHCVLVVEDTKQVGMVVNRSTAAIIFQPRYQIVVDFGWEIGMLVAVLPHENQYIGGN